MSAEMREAAAILCDDAAAQWMAGKPTATKRHAAQAALQLAAAIRAMPVADAWQDISTAPEWLQSNVQTYGCNSVFWRDGDNFVVRRVSSRKFWLQLPPLPAPPQENEK